MSLLRPQPGEIPLPDPGPLTRPWWDGCRRHELMFQRCAACSAATHTPAVVCAGCASADLEWSASSGRGVIHTWTVVWRPVSPAFEVPYAPIIVEMDEGWFTLSCLVGCDHEEIGIGLPVEVEFHDHPGGLTLPYFRRRA